MVVDPRGTGPYDGLSSYVALAQPMTDFVRLVKDVLSFFCSFSIYVLFLSLQIMLSSNSWKGFHQFSSINVYEVLDVMLKSRADSTTISLRSCYKKVLGLV